MSGFRLAAKDTVLCTRERRFESGNPDQPYPGVAELGDALALEASGPPMLGSTARAGPKPVTRNFVVYEVFRI
jgi:hypothetical protein